MWSIDRTLSVATTAGQSGLGSNGNGGVLNNPQSSSITGVLSDCLVSYLGHSLIIEHMNRGSLALLQKSSRCILQPQPTGPDHLKPIYNSSVLIDVAWKTHRKQWTIEINGGRGSGKSVLVACHDDISIDISYRLVDIIFEWPNE